MLELTTLDCRSRLRWIMVWHWRNWRGPERAGLVLQNFWVGDLRHLGGKRVYRYHIIKRLQSALNGDIRNLQLLI